MVEVSWTGVVLAALANIVIGGAWYGIFSAPWLKAVGKKKEEISGGSRGYAMAAVGALVTAYVMTHFVVQAMAFYPEVGATMSGALTGFYAWLGFVAPVLTMKQAWEGKSWTLWLIDNGNMLLSLVVMGMILASFQ